MQIINIKSQRGISILEVVIAMSILAVTAFGLEMVYTRSVQAQVNSLNTVKAMIALDAFFQRSILNPQTRYGQYKTPFDLPISNDYEITTGRVNGNNPEDGMADYYRFVNCGSSYYVCANNSGLDLRSLLVYDLRLDGMTIYQVATGSGSTAPNRGYASIIGWGGANYFPQDMANFNFNSYFPDCVKSYDPSVKIIKNDNLFNWRGGNCIVLTHF